MPGTLVYRLLQVFWAGIDLLLPPSCGGCGAHGVRWCISCQESAQKIEIPVCDRCGQSQSRPGWCKRCEESPPSFQKLRSWATFSGPLRKALHRLKYRRDLGLGEALAYHLVECYRLLGWQVDLVAPVPLGVARRKERGYNQVAYLAYPMAIIAGLPYSARALRRIRETRSQVGLTVEERRDNVTGAFFAFQSRVSGADVLVVDDVVTSGATMNACAAALLDAGANAVYGLTLARAVLSFQPEGEIFPPEARNSHCVSK